MPSGLPRRARPPRPDRRRPRLPSWVEEPGLLLTEIGKRIEHPAGRRRGRGAARWRTRPTRSPSVRGARWPTTRTSRAVRGAARARPPDRAADRGPQLLDRPDGAVGPAPVRLARRRPAGRGRRHRRARRHPVPPSRRGARAPARRRRPPRPRRGPAGATTPTGAASVPPRKVGKPAERRRRADRFDGVRLDSTDPDELRGTGASAGIVRGRRG